MGRKITQWPEEMRRDGKREEKRENIGEQTRREGQTQTDRQTRRKHANRQAGKRAEDKRVQNKSIKKTREDKSKLQMLVSASPLCTAATLIIIQLPFASAAHYLWHWLSECGAPSNASSQAKQTITNYQ